MIRCAIIDDSTLALDLLEDYISRVNYLQLVKHFNNSIEALEFLKKTEVDLIFVDIQMPDLTGLELIRSLEKKPRIIFTTAYADYAIEGFDLDVTDYLLKPFSFERFKKATDKVMQQMELEKHAGQADQSIFVKSGYEVMKIRISDIEYIEALKDYIQIFTKDQKILSLMSMKDILEMLPAGSFVRIHRSYIIPVDKAGKISTKNVTVGKKEFPVGEMYRDEFIKLLRKKGILS